MCRTANIALADAECSASSPPGRVIYPDAGFAAIYDRRARENLARELASLIPR